MNFFVYLLLTLLLSVLGALYAFEFCVPALIVHSLTAKLMRSAVPSSVESKEVHALHEILRSMKKLN